MANEVLNGMTNFVSDVLGIGQTGQGRRSTPLTPSLGDIVGRLEAEIRAGEAHLPAGAIEEEEAEIIPTAMKSNNP